MGLMGKSEPITLGKRYRDSISGFEGVATGRFEYLYGCVRYELEGGMRDGKVEDLIFDEQRLVAVDEKPVQARATAGGPKARPTR